MPVSLKAAARKYLGKAINLVSSQLARHHLNPGGAYRMPRYPNQTDGG
jgi:hypothetical protein